MGDTRVTRALEQLAQEAELSPDSTMVWRRLISAGPASVPDLTQALQLRTEAVTAAMETLHDLRLVIHSGTEDQPVVEALPPDVALAGWAEEVERTLARSLVQGHALRRLGPALAEASLSSSSANPVRVVTLEDPKDLQAEILRLGATAEEEVISMVSRRPRPESWVASRPHDLALLNKGLRSRALYVSSVLNDPEAVHGVRWLQNHGAMLRFAPALPMRMLVFDGHTALLQQSPASSEAGAVVVDHPGIVSALLYVFESSWEGADELSEGVRAGNGASLNTLEREILRMFSRGAKDESVARRLDISVRTVRRMVAVLCERLDASSRFELGMRAVELELLSTPSQAAAAERASS